MKKLIVLVVTLLLVGVASWAIAAQVESPEQVAARAEAPIPDPVIATLERGYLQGPVTLSTTAQLERTVVVSPPASLTGVVTFVERAPGETLWPGAVLLRSNGRPVFVLPGAFALYRDLQPGDSGDDVAAVQAGLKAAGFAIGRDRSGTYGAGTQAAVRQMYKTAGYVAPEAEVAPRVSTGTTEGAAPGTTTPAAPTPTAPTVAAGPRVLTTEVVMIADLPAVVQSIASVGSQLSADIDLVTLGAGRTVLAATLPSESVGALSVGAAGAFPDDAGGQGTARIAAVTPDASTGQTVVALSATGAVAAGNAYVVTIDNPAAESGGSLLAPVAAVVARGGRSYVYVRSGGAFQEVEVQVAGTVGGVVAIVPVESEPPLDDGTEVRIG